MEKEVLSIEQLEASKRIFEKKDEDNGIFEWIRTLFGFSDNDDSKKRQKKILSYIVDDRVSIYGDAIKVAIKDIISHHQNITGNETITKISDIKTNANFKDFITFIEEDGYDYYVIGDIHDDLYSLNQILKGIDFANNFDKTKLIFLGDYVDRGKDRVNVINKLIILKYLLPENIFLLRGNHELYKVDEKGNYYSIMQGASPQGYHFDFLTYLVTAEDEKIKALREQNKIDKELVELYAKLFDSMATVALFNFKDIKICAVHGGLPRPNLRYKNFYEANEFESFNTLLDDKTLDSVGFKQKLNMIWSDPYDGYEEAFKDTSEIRFSFSKDEFVAFCKKYDIDLFLRAHEQQSRGYKAYFNNRLISVFSSGGKNRDEEKIVNEHSYYSDVSPNILKISSDRLESININFVSENICKLEQYFLYKFIKKSKEEQENEYNDYLPNDTCSNNLEPSENAILIVDCWNIKNKRILPLSSLEPIDFSYGNLQQFSGVYKGLKFRINPKDRKITNLCDKSLLIDGEDGVVLNKDDSVQLRRKSIVEIENGMRLIVLL